MTEVVLEHPAELAEDSTYGGFADIARRLNALHPERQKPISRQLVQRWFTCREVNNFPEATLVKVKGKWGSLFDVEEAVRWYIDRERSRVDAGKAPIETIPLFDVDRRGHPIDAEQYSARRHPSDEGGYQSSILDI
jgi:hypothetical protein